jgi:putative endonuclease
VSPTGQYWVYILASHSRRLYVGVTNDLTRRMRERKAGVGSAFASRYHINRLVHHEEFRDVRDAIRREKEIKAWRREKKLRLVESHDAGWLDLAARGCAPEASGDGL